METYKSILTYDGTDFQGFQRQAAGRRTVQGELERALRTVGWEEDSLKAAGRTDAGVHARGQVVSFAMTWRAGPEALKRALNANLPQDVAVRRVEVAHEDFHPRFSAKGRHYSYSLYCVDTRDPLRLRYAWEVWPLPSLEMMNEASRRLLGRRDFAAFGRAPVEGGHTLREIFLATWRSVKDGLIFDIEADAFLYHMVRRLVAVMVSIGQGKTSTEVFQELLDDPKKRWEGSIAPPTGLCLEEVVY
ncbi:MAG: tRNA pseudouridine(38-40) synthase TruA [Anaerolineales bacterium]|nr:tRNA pseudouridine(38-40) synthase TruA [Anaerolineales bacterium]